MGKGSEIMWWVMPCRHRKYVRTESQMGIEEILRSKLATIEEVPENCEENGMRTKHRRSTMPKKGKKKKNHLKVMMGCLFTPHFSLKESYVLFISGFASKRSLQGGVVRY